MVAKWPSADLRSANSTSDLSQVLERQLPFDAAIFRARDRGQLKREIPERVGLADLQFTRRRQRAGTRDPRDGILRLGVGQPSARVVAEDEMPLVPRAVFVLVDDAPGDREGVALKPPARADLDGRAGERQVRDDAHRLEVDVVAHDDGPAVPAHRLHRARPAELDGRRAVGARGDGAGHGCGGKYRRSASCLVLRAVLRAACCVPGATCRVPGRRQGSVRSSVATASTIVSATSPKNCGLTLSAVSVGWW